MPKPPRCHFDNTNGWMTPEHRADCKTNTCNGCRPCPKSHCDLTNHCANHVERSAGINTCATCIGRVRRNLHAIDQLYALAIPDEAIEAGTDSEAMNLIGPASLSFQTDYRRGWCAFPAVTNNDPNHPTIVLGDWDIALRDIYGPATSLNITVPRAVAYLISLLGNDSKFPHEDQFAQFAKSINKLRTHLEAVAHDSHGPEEGAPCPECSPKPRKLQKRYGTESKHDTWHCPTNPAHWWSDTDYRLRIEGSYVEHADWLPGRDAAQRLGITVGALHVRASRNPRGKKRFDGKMLYSVRLLA